jgi:hypothetical protein
MVEIRKRISLKLSAFSFALIVCSVVFVQCPLVCSQSTNMEKALAFLNNVSGLDMAKYEVKLDDYRPNTVGDADFTGSYILTSSNAQVTAHFIFKNNSIVFCHAYRLSGGSLLFLDKAPISPIAAVSDFLTRYKEFLGGSYLQPIQDILGAVTEFKDTVKTTIHTLNG